MRMVYFILTTWPRCPILQPTTAFLVSGMGDYGVEVATTSGLSRAARKYQTTNSTLRMRLVILLSAKNDCSDWFNKGTGSAPEIMSHVPILSYASKDSVLSPADAKTDEWPSSPIFVNDKGRFYATSQNGLSVGDVYPPGSLGARMVIVLHELAHKVHPEGITHDGSLDSTVGASEKNTQKVIEHCEKA